jgi:hypothetical protein
MINRLFLCFISLAALTATACAQTPAAQPVRPPNENIDWPSPDGKFAFLTFHDNDNYQHTIDLIDRKSGQKLRIDESDSSVIGWRVLWAPDSNRFALMTREGHPMQGVDVYFRSGEAFEKIELPKLPEAEIPEKLKRGKKFPHIANWNWQEAEEWRKDGSLVVTIDTMIDGDSGSITATRAVVVGFDPAGKARIMTSTIKYKTETN